MAICRTPAHGMATSTSAVFPVSRSSRPRIRDRPTFAAAGGLPGRRARKHNPPARDAQRRRLVRLRRLAGWPAPALAQPVAGRRRPRGHRRAPALRAPFWNGQRNDDVPEAEGLEFEANIQPVVVADEDEDAPSFAFNPLEMGEEALLTFFGYQIEGGVQAPPVDGEQIVLLSFRRSQGDRPASPLSPAPAKDAKPWWKFW
jgi:hypothetical protein